MKKIYKLFLIILCVFILNIKVKADDRISTSFSNSISATYSGTITREATIMNKKYNNAGRAFCTLFWYPAPSGTCTAIKWNSNVETNKKIAVAIGAMINKARSLTNSGNTINEDAYFYGEMAINHFLYTHNGKKTVNNVSNLYSWGTISSKSYFKSIYSAGTTAYNNYGKTSVQFTNPTISVSSDRKTITATATLRCYNSSGNAVGCSAAVKDTLTITGKYEDGTDLSVKIGAKAWPKSTSPDIHYNYSYEYTVPEGKTIKSDETVTGSFSTKNKVSYAVAQNYNCGSAYQSLTPNSLMTLYEYDNTTAKATTTTNNCSITINKKGENSVALKGAKFNLYSDSAVTNKIDSGISNSNGVILFDGLIPGTYYYKEIVAPKGYVLNNTIKTIDLTADDCNKSVDVLNSTATGSITISKTDGNGKAVEGAKIRVFTVPDNATFNFDDAMDSITNETLNSSGGEYTNLDNNEYSFNYLTFGDKDYFVTTTSPKVITDLKVGETYYIYEESIPEGSDYSIKVGSDSVYVEEAKNYNVELVNIHSNFKISKQDITTKKELPGAEIQILDSRGIEIEKWISTNTPKEIKGLEDGDYTLVEITAPKGYKKAETIKFTIENGKLKNDADNILVMYDDITKVEVPDTLSARNVLIVLLGLTLTAIGLGIFVYGIKKKDEI